MSELSPNTLFFFNNIWPVMWMFATFYVAKRYRCTFFGYMWWMALCLQYKFGAFMVFGWACLFYLIKEQFHKETNQHFRNED